MATLVETWADSAGLVAPAPARADSLPADSARRPPRPTWPRDPALRPLYARAALAQIPRLLTALDRHPLRPTYGCFDRQFWHYRTAAFPSGMYEEGALALALVYRHALPENRWHGTEAVREWVLAALRYAAASAHRDGSCDDYYPLERALGAAVFSLTALARAAELLEVRDGRLLDFLVRRARWVAAHGETGRLANHQALAALGLWRMFEITGDDAFRRAAQRRVETVLAWQSAEGWFDEYGGADPGYQTLTLECLAQLEGALGSTLLEEPIARGLSFARHFLHPDRSFGGIYGSRGTYHFFPHGMELLAGRRAEAADLADGFLAALATGRTASLEDDRLVAHRLGSLIEAYLAWAPRRPEPAEPPTPLSQLTQFPRAGLCIRGQAGSGQTIVSTARGGALRHQLSGQTPWIETGLVLELADGRLASSDWHGHQRQVEVSADGQPTRAEFSGAAALAAIPSRAAAIGPAAAWIQITGRLIASRFETATPLKQALLHLGMISLGRWLRTPVRWLLQRRLITGRTAVPITHRRTIEWREPRPGEWEASLRISDRITLESPSLSVRRMAIVADGQGAYVAAAGTYQEASLAGGVDLSAWVERLNQRRTITLIRQLGAGADCGKHPVPAVEEAVI